MNIRTSLIGIAAVAVISLSACSSTTGTAASPQAAGTSTIQKTDQPSSGTTADDTTTKADDSTAADSTTADGSTADGSTPGDSTSADGSTADGSTTGDSTSADGSTAAGESSAGVGGKCAGLVKFVEAFNKNVLGKLTSSSITQADVDATFTDENLNGIPSALAADVAKLKTSANALVGKKIQDSLSEVTKIQAVYQDLASKLATECTG